MSREYPAWMDEIAAEDLPEQFKRYSDIIGVRGAVALAAEFGGEYTYIPKLDALTKSARDRHMWRDYQSGMNARVLAHKYDLSVVQVYEITNRIKAAEYGRSLQPNLFDFPESS